jgi:hypothetical protein
MINIQVKRLSSTLTVAKKGAIRKEEKESWWGGDTYIHIYIQDEIIGFNDL